MPVFQTPINTLSLFKSPDSLFPLLTILHFYLIKLVEDEWSVFLSGFSVCWSWRLTGLWNTLPGEHRQQKLRSHISWNIKITRPKFTFVDSYVLRLNKKLFLFPTRRGCFKNVRVYLQLPLTTTFVEHQTSPFILSNTHIFPRIWHNNTPF